MSKRRKGEKISGWINFDKPEGMTSTQAVGKIRYLYNAQKAGHAGTLDPLATGILPIALGEATKTIQYAQDALKEYSFNLVWGETRNTDDAEGEVTDTSDVRVDKKAVLEVLPKFIGDIEQTPPAFSAIKVDGKRAYDLARAGEDVQLKSRPAYIENIELLSHSGDITHLRVTSGKGVYMRSLARDIALKCGSLGYISNLRRHKVSAFAEDSAFSLDKLEGLRHKDALDTALLPLNTVLADIPALNLKQAEASRLKNGNALSFIARPDMERITNIGIDVANQNEPTIVLACFEDTPLGLVEILGVNIQPIKMFNL